MVKATNCARNKTNVVLRVVAMATLTCAAVALQACGGASSAPDATTKPPAADVKPVFETPPKQG